MEWLKALQTQIGYQAQNDRLLLQALSHKSYIKRNLEHPVGNNERLEFIGDAVVDLVIATDLYRIFPEDNEGSLSRKRASLVNEETLYHLAMRLKLDEFILVDDVENGKNNLRSSRRLLSGTLEAIIGAIYEDRGFETAKAWTQKLFEEQGFYQFSDHDFAKDYKTRFQELIQEKMKVTPSYRTVGFSGPDHQKMFQVEVLVFDEVYGVGEGESKKMAEQVAAENALKRMNDVV
ncbi:ribonuclease III [bacterium]|nr:ribonuclease III [bacterium]